MNTLPTTTATKRTAVEQAIALRQSIQNLPATVNNRSIAVVDKAKDAYGEVGVNIAAAAVTLASSFYLGKLGYAAAGSLVQAGAGPTSAAWALGLGATAAAAPAVGGFISQCTKDGVLRGIAEGALFVTLPFFAGHYIGTNAVNDTVGGNWVGVVMALAGAALYISGNVKRHGS